jgi:TPR repeat protein
VPNTCWFLAAAALATLTLAAADFSTGMDAYKKGDFATAAKEWRPLADQGNAAAQYNLGLLYLDGKGVPKGDREAANWMHRAAERDHEQAQHKLGAMYGRGQGVKRDYVQAYMWLNLCAGKGNAECGSERDEIEKKLKPEQLREAQRLSTGFSPIQSKP